MRLEISRLDFLILKGEHEYIHLTCMKDFMCKTHVGSSNKHLSLC